MTLWDFLACIRAANALARAAEIGTVPDRATLEAVGLADLAPHIWQGTDPSDDPPRAQTNADRPSHGHDESAPLMPGFGPPLHRA